MPDSVDTVRAKTNPDDIQSAIDTWLTDNSGITSLDDVELAREGKHYTVITFLYTA